MKDCRIWAAAFLILLLLIPLVSVQITQDMQQNEGKNSLAVSASTKGGGGEQTGSSTAAVETFKVFRTSAGKVEEIPADDYICGVVAAEMPASYGEEALKAQAAAAFTYACYKRNYNLSHPSAGSSIGGADLTDDYHHDDSYLSQQDAKAKWGSSFAADWAKISAAVSAVRNKVITYNGKPIEALFFSASPGETESSKNVWGDDVPYLVPVDSTWDKDAPDFASTVKISGDAFKETVRSSYAGVTFGASPAQWLSIGKKSQSGLVLEANLCGKTVTGGSVMSLFKLRSAAFDVGYANGTFTFTVRGDGHDVGMSQYGAGYLAKQGEKWDAIVKHYYKGVSISDYDWKSAK